MEHFVQWAKNIVYYMLFVKLLIAIVSNAKMISYIKFVSGIILMIILIQPISLLLSNESELKHAIINSQFNLNRQSFAARSKVYDTVNSSLESQIYEDRLKENILARIESNDYRVEQMEIAYIEDTNSEEFGALTEVKIYIRMTNGSELEKEMERTEENSENSINYGVNILVEKKIKNTLFNFYNLPRDNIHVIIKG